MLSVDNIQRPTSCLCVNLVTVCYTSRFTATVTYFRYCDDVTGHVVATVRAHDLDSDDNGRIRYELETSRMTHRRLFHVDSRTGQLSLAETLPDTDASVYHVYISAIDHGQPPRSDTASLKVVVGQAAAQQLMTSRVGVSVYVTSAVCVGCFLLVLFLLVLAVVRRRRRQGNHHQHHHHRHHHRHHHERLETRHILPSYDVDKSHTRPLRDLEPSTLLDDFSAHRLQVIMVFVVMLSLSLKLVASLLTIRPVTVTAVKDVM